MSQDAAVTGEAAIEVEQYVPFSPQDVSDWLLAQPYTPSTHALIATMEALEADDLFSWGTEPGSKADGEYERAHAAFYALERVLHEHLLADGYEV